MTSSIIRLGPASDLLEGQARGHAGARVFALRHAARLHAWRDACPHYGDTPLAWRRDAYLNADGSRVVCAAHGAQFEPDTGLCVLGPCLGRSLERVPLRVGADGVIELFVGASRDTPTSASTDRCDPPQETKS